MKALDEKLKIGHGLVDEHGQKLEPEEQPVQRVITTIADVKLGNAPGQGTAAGMPMRTNVTAETTAAEIADDLAHSCQFCAHWDQQAYRIARQSYDVEELDEQRAAVLEIATPEEMLVFHRREADVILDACFGRCQALGHYSPDGHLDMHARATCPAYGPNGAIPNAFQARSDSRRQVDSIRDTILRTAAGKE